MKAARFIGKVDENGQINVPNLPLKKGSKVEIIILSDDFEDEGLLKACESSVGFWNNPIDDEVWNDA